MKKLSLLIVLPVFIFSLAVKAQQMVQPGLDLLETSGNFTFEDLNDLSFLCPGCSIVSSPNIQLQGIPLEPDFFAPGTGLGETDTIIKRNEPPTPELDIGDSAIVDIEIVALHLQSVEPFQVDFGNQTENWMLDIRVDPGQSTGVMQINKTDHNGGFFNSQIFVNPVFTFFNFDNPAIFAELFPIVELNIDPASVWSHTAENKLEIAPGIIDPLGSSNFNPGIQFETLANSGFQTNGTGSASSPTSSPFNFGLTLNQNIAEVPEPATLWLTGLGCMFIFLRSRRKVLRTVYI